MTEALVKKEEDRVALARRTVAKSLNDSEFDLYVYDCQRRGIHPLDKLIIPTIRTDKQGNRTYTPITTVDYLRSRADSTGLYAGNDDPVFDSEEKPQKATVTVYKMVAGQRVAFTATARWSQYYPSEPNKQFMWNRMPHLMLGKCAEGLAIRKAFPQELAGLYTKEEMDQAGTEAPTLPTPETIEANSDLFEDPEPNAMIPEVNKDTAKTFLEEFSENASKATLFLELATLTNQYVGIASKLKCGDELAEVVKTHQGRLLTLHEDPETLVDIPNDVPLHLYSFFYAMDEVGRKSGYPGMKNLYYQFNDVLKQMGLADVWKKWCGSMKKEIESLKA